MGAPAVPAGDKYDVPGADDEAIFADIVRSLGRDQEDARTALAMLREIVGGDLVPFDPGRLPPLDPARLRR